MKLTIPEKIAKKEQEIAELNHELGHMLRCEQQLTTKQFKSDAEKEQLIQLKTLIKSTKRKIQTREYAIYDLRSKLSRGY